MTDAQAFKTEFDKCKELFSSGGSKKDPEDGLAEELNKLKVEEGSEEKNSPEDGTSEKAKNGDNSEEPPKTTEPESDEKKPPEEANKPESENTTATVSS